MAVLYWRSAKRPEARWPEVAMAAVVSLYQELHMPDTHNQAFATRAVHAGERAPRPDYTPVVAPNHPTVGYLYDSMDDLDAIFATTREGYV